jgi:hypothetical protein
MGSQAEVCVGNVSIGGFVFYVFGKGANAEGVAVALKATLDAKQDRQGN